MSPNTLAEALEAVWNRWPERPALVFGPRRVTYAQFEQAARQLAGLYRRLGLTGGDRVICAMSNRPEKMIALAASWLSGTVHVGVDYQYTAPELSAVIELTGARALLYEPVEESPDPLLPLQTLRTRFPDLLIAVVGDYPVPDSYTALSALLAEPGIESTLPAPGPQDPAIIFISSGTTGKPKAAIGYHGNLVRRWQWLAEALDFGPEDVHLAPLPLAHGFGLMMAVTGLLTGGELVLLPRFSAEETLQVIKDQGVTVFNGAPAHFKLLLNRLDPARHDVRSLRTSVGTAASFSPPLLRAIMDDLGVKFMHMYGSSEGVGVVTTDRDDILLGSVGRPEPGSVAIVGTDHEPLPTGEIGEIAFSRKFYPIRYWSGTGPASQDAPSSGDNWYYSGDLGRLDKVGRLYIFGRLKHQIDRGGLKVDPVEVEGALLRCPGVADAAVIGLPNPILGETVCACVVPTQTNGAVPTLEQLRATLGSQLTPYKLPESLCILERIPRTQIGKVDLDALRTNVMATTAQPR